MSKRLRSSTRTEARDCCVCIRESSGKYHKINDSYAKTQKTTILEILIQLNLLNYEVSLLS